MAVVKPLPATASGEIAALEEMTILSSSIAAKAYAFPAPKIGDRHRAVGRVAVSPRRGCAAVR